MSVCSKIAGLIVFAGSLSVGGLVAEAADIPSWMRGALVKQCLGDAPSEMTDEEANRYCKCFVRELADDLSNEDLASMVQGQMTKRAAGGMMQSAGRCLQEN